MDKSTNSLRWVIDGKVQATYDVRFGSDELPTREGAFTVFEKSRDHVSSLYDTSMPFAMFFSGGQAVHYSPDFAANGYNGASHGCVNVRDYDGIAWLFDQVQIGDKVIVYWSWPWRFRGRSAPGVGSRLVTTSATPGEQASPLVARTVALDLDTAASLLDLLPADHPSPGCAGARGWSAGAWPPRSAPSGATRFADAGKWWAETNAHAVVRDEVERARQRPGLLRLLRLRRRAGRLRAGRPRGRRRPPRRHRLADHDLARRPRHARPPRRAGRGRAAGGARSR